MGGDHADVSDDRSLFLGDDANGVTIEVAGIELESGDLLVIHAMKLRTAYRSRYQQALEYREFP